MIHFADRREDGIKAIEQAIGQPFPLPDEWDVLTAIDGDSVIGAAIVKGNEVHCGTIGPFFLRPLIRSLLVGLLETHGSVVTKCRPGNTIGRRFVERLGFVKTGETEVVVTYELKELRHV